jgi:Asp-tRNA(Asn)/Glu-tRNA(Gln) amidotransferase B subunit
MPESNLPSIFLSSKISQKYFFLALPSDIRDEIISTQSLSLEKAFRLAGNLNLLKYYRCCLFFAPKSPDVVANLLLNEIGSIMEENNLSLQILKLHPRQLVELADMKVVDDLPHNILICALNILCVTDFCSAEELVRNKEWRITARNRQRIVEVINSFIDKNPTYLRICQKGEENGYRQIAKLISKNYGEKLDMFLVANLLRREIFNRIE